MIGMYQYSSYNYTTQYKWSFCCEWYSIIVNVKDFPFPVIMCYVRVYVKEISYWNFLWSENVLVRRVFEIFNLAKKLEGIERLRIYSKR